MKDRLRKKVKSIVFAGLEPEVRQAKSRPKHSRGRWREWLDQYLSGGRHHDPLYLSNRSFGQKLFAWFKVALPLALAVWAVVYGIRATRHVQPPPRVLSPAEIAAKMLPELNKPIEVPMDNDVEVVEVHVERDAGVKLTGKLRNKSGHALRSAEVEFILTGPGGTKVGATIVTVNNVAAGETVAFAQPIAEKTANFALVRTIRSD